MKKAVVLSKTDNVATALEDISKGDGVEIINSEKKPVYEIISLSNIKRGHKISLSDIKKGDEIIKYGYVIGIASSDIKKGEFVHTHNLESERGRGDLFEN